MVLVVNYSPQHSVYSQLSAQPPSALPSPPQGSKTASSRPNRANRPSAAAAAPRPLEGSSEKAARKAAAAASLGRVLWLKLAKNLEDAGFAGNWPGLGRSRNFALNCWFVALGGRKYAGKYLGLSLLQGRGWLCGRKLLN